MLITLGMSSASRQILYPASVPGSLPLPLTKSWLVVRRVQSLEESSLGEK